MKFNKKVWILFIAFIGFLATVQLATIYYEANFNPYALSSFCSINEFIDCDKVAKTSHAIFLGIPLAYWGMFFYVFIILLTLSPDLKKYSVFKFMEVFKNPYSYIALLGFVSFAISIVLACISIFAIKKICVLCFFTYFLNLLIAALALPSSENILKVSIADFMEAIKIKKYLISFIIVVLLGSSALVYTSVSYVFAPHIKRYESIKSFMDMKENPFKSNGNILGDKNAKIKVDVYSDYRCPMCYSANLMIHRAAKELSGIIIKHHNYPLDMECNKYLKEPFHEGSCVLARYSIAAENQGKYWDFNSEVFEKQPNNEEELLELAKKLGFDIDKLAKDANSKEVKAQLAQEIDTAVELGVNGTPAMFLNGKMYMGVVPYYELKDKLMKAGAVERK